jgi:hypothetical protein
MQGHHENSRKAYDDFFTTWKDADPAALRCHQLLLHLHINRPRIREQIQHGFLLLLRVPILI